MKLNTRGRYAVMAMSDLAKHAGPKAVTLAELSQRQDISLSYLEQLFGKLRRAGLVAAVRGPHGGYRLARPADAIAIADVVLAVDEPLKATRCHSGGGCVGGQRCLTHDLWDELGHRIEDFLASVTLADVIERRVGRNARPRPILAAE